MRLSRLELFGFKSFLNRTILRFNDGITAIIGPNGCGKSNIVDAIIWSLGERGTKSLRVKDMGDVIFHGSNGKRPVNIAEVAIELSDGGRDVLVKRRIYRDGSNEYFMNGASVRLRDVQDFFLGTGIGMNSYAIVEQGKIEHFIQMKPQERKIVIEETSGVTRFEEKKRDAMVRLEEVSKNLERIEDIYREVTKAFEKASDEWERWKIFKALDDSLREVDAHILVDGHRKLSRRMERIRERQQGIEEEIEKQLELKEGTRKQLELKEQEFTLTETLSRQVEVDMKAKEKDMENRLLEMEYVQEEQRRLKATSDAATKRLTNCEADANRVKAEIEEVRLRTLENKGLLKEEEEAAEVLRQKNLELKASVEKREKQIEETRVRLFVSMSKITELRNRAVEAERAAQERARREQRRQEEQQRLREKLGRLEGEKRGLQEVLKKAKEAKEELAGKERVILGERERVSKALNDTRNGLERLRGEQRAKEQFLKSFAKETGGSEIPPPGTSKLINVVTVEEGTEETLERFFFKEMGYHVVPTDDLGGVADLVSRHNENFIFFPHKGLFKRKGGEVEIGVARVHDLEEALRRVEAGEEGVFLSDDSYVDSRGIILREKETKRIDLRRFKEKLRVEKELKELDAGLKEAFASVTALQNSQGELERSLKDLRVRVRESEEHLSRAERAIIQADAELKTTVDRLRELDEGREPPDETPLADIDQLLLKQKVEEKEKEKLEAEISTHRRDLDEVKKASEVEQVKWHEITIGIERRRSLLNALGKDVERKAGQIEQFGIERQTLQTAIDQALAATGTCAAKIAALEKEYEALRIAAETLTTRFEELKKASGDLHVERSALQEKIGLAAKEMEKQRGRIEGLEREAAVLSEKRDTIYERLTSLYGITNPAEITLPGDRDFDTEREDLAGKIKDLGEINFRAEKEYMELKERITFLETQKDDLHNASDSLKKTITKMDHLSREMFLETFHTVNEAFKKFTQMLFKGGSGYLNFNQETQGIDMYAQPPGKKVIRMELLSGGEKALISLAFLFSLMDTNPSPFSLLDEIDAPLDDANLASLLEIIKVISLKTQILFITHNRITMESSDTIYGITMEEEGISKVVSVKL
jgi:chromosome segregation protein